MRTGGRRSAASYLGPTLPGARPKAPDELTPDEAIEWDKIVERMPTDWFGPETFPMLIQLCRLTVAARRIADEMNRVMAGPLHEVSNFDRFREWQRMAITTAGAIGNLSTKLRLSQQSRYDNRVAANAAHKANAGPTPWMLPDDDTISDRTN
jgi:hypothetical protein